MLETKPLVYKYSKYCKINRVKIQRNKLHKKIVEKHRSTRQTPPFLHHFVVSITRPCCVLIMIHTVPSD